MFRRYFYGYSGLTKIGTRRRSRRQYNRCRNQHLLTGRSTLEPVVNLLKMHTQSSACGSNAGERECGVATRDDGKRANGNPSMGNLAKILDFDI